MTQNEMTPIREKIALRIKQLGITKKSVCEDLGLTLQNFWVLRMCSSYSPESAVSPSTTLRWC